jgi:ABC-type metal ion transport system substrate-binding protein
MKTEITEKQVQIMKHALGISKKPKPYRNHYVADKGHHSYEDLKFLVKAGYMGEKTKSTISDTISDGGDIFYVTEVGMALFKTKS